jgi:predicted MPP superfamily phosphohydrolase
VNPRFIRYGTLALAAMMVFLGRLDAQRAERTGVVFEDLNGNGVRDTGEPGVPGVAVSDQDTVVLTAANGAYRIASRGADIVFVSTPDGYRAVGSFWHTGDPGTPIVFALARAARGRELTFVHASDTHISPASAGRTRRLRALEDSIHPDFLLITGDLVRDALRVGEAEATGYYTLFMHEMAALHTTLFTVPGNHENFGIERDSSHVSQAHPLYGRRMYHHFLGPDYYSFTRGGVHFIGLNTVDIDDQHYYGHVDSLQLAWLERDLALVPATMAVVTFDHIPFFTSFETVNGYEGGGVAPTLITVNGKTAFRHSVSNAGDVLAVLRRRRHVLALGGHLHGTERIAFETNGVQTRFNQISAVIGPPTGAGLTFVSGITLYRVNGGEVDAGQFIRLDPTP